MDYFQLPYRRSGSPPQSSTSRIVLLTFAALATGFLGGCTSKLNNANGPDGNDPNYPADFFVPGNDSSTASAVMLSSPTFRVSRASVGGDVIHRATSKNFVVKGGPHEGL